VAVPLEPLDQVRAEEPSAAGDEDAHAGRVPRGPASAGRSSIGRRERRRPCRHRCLRRPPPAGAPRARRGRRGGRVPLVDHPHEPARVPLRRGLPRLQRLLALDGPAGRGRCLPAPLLPLVRRLQEPALPVRAGRGVRPHRAERPGRARALGRARPGRRPPARAARPPAHGQRARGDGGGRARRADALALRAGPGRAGGLHPAPPDHPAPALAPAHGAPRPLVGRRRGRRRGAARAADVLVHGQPPARAARPRSPSSPARDADAGCSPRGARSPGCSSPPASTPCAIPGR